MQKSGIIYWYLIVESAFFLFASLSFLLSPTFSPSPFRPSLSLNFIRLRAYFAFFSTIVHSYLWPLRTTNSTSNTFRFAFIAKWWTSKCKNINKNQWICFSFSVLFGCLLVDRFFKKISISVWIRLASVYVCASERCCCVWVCMCVFYEAIKIPVLVIKGVTLFCLFNYRCVELGCCPVGREKIQVLFLFLVDWMDDTQWFIIGRMVSLKRIAKEFQRDYF